MIPKKIRISIVADSPHAVLCQLHDVVQRCSDWQVAECEDIGDGLKRYWFDYVGLEQEAGASEP